MGLSVPFCLPAMERTELVGERANLYAEMTKETTLKTKRFALIFPLIGVLAVGMQISINGFAQTEIKYAAMPILSQAPLVIGQRKGFFEAEGIKLTLVRVQTGAQGVEAMMAGSVHAAHIADAPLINAAASGLNIIAVADNGRITKDNTQSAILVRSESPIRTLADLKGKTLASLPPGTITDVQLKALVFPKLGLKPGTDVSIVVAGVPHMEGLLRAGTVDAAVQYEPFITMMLKSGNFRAVSRLNEYIPEEGNYISMITFRRDFASANPDSMRRFLRAYLKAVAVYTQDSDERAAAIVEWIKLPIETIRDVPPLAMSANGKIAVEALTSVTQSLEKLGYLKKPVDIRPYVDNRYLP